MKYTLLALLAACGASHPTHTPPPPDAAPAPAPDAATALQDPPPPGLRLPTAIVPTAAELHLVVDPDQPTYTGTVSYTLHGDNSADVVWLDADPSIAITDATIDGFRVTPLSTSADGRIGFRAPHPISDGTLALAFTGAVRDDQNGVFVEDEGGKKYMFSQGEAIAARKAFPCFDEPSFKMPWTVSITAPAADSVYGNETETSATPADASVTHAFAPTPALPSYLVVFAAGPFEAVDVGKVGKNQIPARVIVPAGRSADAAAATAWLPKVVAGDEAFLDRPLPWDKVDVVGVPVFFGAMENPGMITYETDGLLADAAHTTPRFTSHLIGTLSHELGHFWFGDDVTLAWWDDLWLNESFADWVAGNVLDKLDPKKDDTLLPARASDAMSSDARLATHALRRPITANDQIEGGFDAISYNKGATLLAAAQRQLGDAKFLAAIRSYLDAHERGNATSDDLLTAIAAEDATAADSLRAYLDQPGVPLVRATLDCPNKALHLHQERLVLLGEDAPAAVWPIHVCAAWDGGSACTDLTSADGDLGLSSCPAWIDPGAAASYARVLPDDATVAGLAKHLAKVPRVERSRLAADLGALFAVGKTSLGRVSPLIAPLLATRETHDLSSAIELTEALGAAVGADHEAGWRAWVIAHFGKLAAKAPLTASAKETRPAENAREHLLTLVGVEARDAKLGARVKKQLARWLAGKADAPGDLERLLPIAATAGDAGFFDQLVAKLKVANPGDRGAIFIALGSFTDPALIAKADDLLLTGGFDIVDAFGILGAQSGSEDSAKLAANFLRAHWDELVAKVPTFVRGFLFGMQAGCDADTRATLADFGAAHLKDIPDGDRALASNLAATDSCIALRAANAADVTAWLGK